LIDANKRRQSLYFSSAILKEIKKEAARQDRSLSWIAQMAWRISRKEIMSLPPRNTRLAHPED
jgi:uncharacterized small protein (TIGR04563 family)